MRTNELKEVLIMAFLKNLESFRPFFTEEERAEKLAELKGYEETKALYEAYDKAYDTINKLCREAYDDWRRNGYVGEYPHLRTHPACEADSLFRNVYPVAATYVRLERELCSMLSPNQKCTEGMILRYAMDRILMGDDADTVEAEADRAVTEWHRYAANIWRGHYAHSKEPWYAGTLARHGYVPRDQIGAYYSEIAIYWTNWAHKHPAE